MSSTAIVPASDLGDRFPVLAEGSDALEALQANLDGEEFSVFDLDKIAVPSGGGTMWEVPSLDGTEGMKAIRGVMIGVIKRRSFWETSLDEQEGSGTPPDCASDDSVFGRGLYGVGSSLNPEGACKTCPMNQFQENTKGRTSKPCKEQRLILFMAEGNVLPYVVQLAPTSKKEMEKFMLRLSGKQVPYYRAVVEIGLRKVEASPSYSVVVPKFIEAIDSNAGTVLKTMGDQVVAAYNAAASGRPIIPAAPVEAPSTAKK